MIHAAARRQQQAADPGRSTWLSANAGSGKTRVLTDRVARLLLEGVDPQRILCLTYTKAAASEMQNRLFARLGKWAMLADDRLDAQLAELGLGDAFAGAGEGAEALRRQARRLFARAIETPGGLKIQTIHSFCASLLRRFPLEAGVTPQFVEIEERAARLLREAVVEDIAAGARAGVVAGLARHWTGEDFAALTEEVARHRAAFARPLDAGAARRAFGLPPGLDAARLVAEVFSGGEADLMRLLLPALAGGGVRDQEAGRRLAALRADRPGLADLELLEGVLLTGRAAKEPFTAKIGSFPGKAAQKAFPAMAELEALMARVQDARPRRLALTAAERTAALHAFAAVFLPEYERRKAARGWLDFDDLIGRAARLLTDPAAAQWVLFRLDGGIDHILVDEAQDTSPEQWRVIELLAQEFSAGQGAREVRRTIFVVGDRKQSIYSFQGADLAVFERMQEDFRARLAGVGVALQVLTLDHSFRSAVPVLAAVDRTLAGQAGLGGPPSHLAYWEDLPGRVDLWPLVEHEEAPEPAEWYEAVDHVGTTHPDARLADALAAELARLVAAGAPIPDRGAPGGARAITAGDVLVLVRRRSTLFHELIRACKQAGLPVAGADRLKLAGEMAIRDLGALLSFLVTPQDDLSLAGVLRSPLFGWTEDDLYRLAQPRPAELWEALRKEREAHAATLEILDDLRRQVDFLRPYELIDRMLTFHGGRRRLIARLGEEAEDGIDALLAQALSYERLEVPSLSGFVTWLASGEVEVKRQMDAAGGRLRVMTVHGAKGLEAPVVILPDAGPRRPRSTAQILVSDGLPLWAGATGAEPARLEAARAELARAQQEEDRRLLYVAMTRAQEWLIVAGSAGREARSAPCWHDLVAAGLRAAGGEEGPGGAGEAGEAGPGARPETAGATGPGEGAGADAAGPDGTESGQAGANRPETAAARGANGADAGTGSGGTGPGGAGAAGGAGPGALRLDRVTFPTGEGLSLHRGDWPTAAVGPAPPPPPAPPPLEPWVLAPAPLPGEPERPLSPSALGGAKALVGEAAPGLDEEAARERGTRLHRLLEHLPLRPAADWARFGRDLLAGADPRPTEAEMAALIDEAAAVLSAPDLAPFLAPGALAEVGISGPLAALGGRRILGTIDRLIVAPDRVRAVDFKSNAVVPDTPAMVPEGILRQMGAYRAALAALYPGRAVEVALFWTRTGRLMPLPAPLVAAALDRAGQERVGQDRVPDGGGRDGAE